MQVANNSNEAAVFIANAMIDPSIRLEVKDGKIQTTDKKGAWTKAEAENVVKTYMGMVMRETQQVSSLFANMSVKLTDANYNYQVVATHLLEGLIATTDKPNKIDAGLEAIHVLHSSLPSARRNFEDLAIQAKHAECTQIINNLKNAPGSEKPEHIWPLINFYVELQDRQEEVLDGTLTLIPDWRRQAIESGKAIGVKQKAVIVTKILDDFRQNIQTLFAKLNDGHEPDFSELENMIQLADKEYQHSKKVKQERVDALEAQALQLQEDGAPNEEETSADVRRSAPHRSASPEVENSMEEPTYLSREEALAAKKKLGVDY